MDTLKDKVSAVECRTVGLRSLWRLTHIGWSVAIVFLAVLPWMMMGFTQKHRSWTEPSFYWIFGLISLATFSTYLSFCFCAFCRLCMKGDLHPTSPPSELRTWIRGWDYLEDSPITEIMDSMKDYYSDYPYIAPIVFNIHILLVASIFLTAFLDLGNFASVSLHVYFGLVYAIFFLNLFNFWVCSPQHECVESCMAPWFFLSQFLIFFILLHLKLSGARDYSILIVLSPFSLTLFVGIAAIFIVLAVKRECEVCFSLFAVYAPFTLFLIFLGFYCNGLDNPDTDLWSPSIAVVFIPIYHVLAGLFGTSIYVAVAILVFVCDKHIPSLTYPRFILHTSKHPFSESDPSA